MKLKLDEQGHAVIQDGMPVYTHEDGQDRPFDAASTVKTITRLNGEAKQHREAKEQALEQLKAFEGLDPAAARKALETVGNLDSKQLIDAGEVERVKAEAKTAFQQQLEQLEAKYKPVVEERDGLAAKLTDMTIGYAFNGSKFIAENLAVPAPMVRATFGNHFKVEDGRVVGYDANGQRIFSRQNPGEIADLDEALSTIVASYPFRDQIVKGSGASGGGAGGSGGAGGAKSTNRAQFEGMSPVAKATFIKEGGKVVD